jgi:hypothetical protein
MTTDKEVSAFGHLRLQNDTGSSGQFAATGKGDKGVSEEGAYPETADRIVVALPPDGEGKQRAFTVKWMGKFIR